MEARHRESAETLRSSIKSGLHEPSLFRSALVDVPPVDRDAWLDVVLGLEEPPDDGPELPKGGVPYLPCPVADLLQVVDHAAIHEADVFVDIGSGVGRAAAFVHLRTGASAVGLEVQAGLVRAARALAGRLPGARLSWIEGDATDLAACFTDGTVFFLYCPFSGERLAKVLTDLELMARSKTLRVCCVDLPLPPCNWLTLEASPRVGVEIYRST